MNRYREEDYLPLSAIQHFVFCRRQFALIHMERMWEENRLTAEGGLLHRKVDSARPESRGLVRTEYSVPLCSHRLGLFGLADAVEFHREEKKRDLLPFPVEYKRGRSKKIDCDRIQLCAQALCLEEMTGCSIPSGAIYHGKVHRREEVFFGEKLRHETESAAARMHEMILGGVTPRAEPFPGCARCSLSGLCLPEKLHREPSVIDYLAKRRN